MDRKVITLSRPVEMELAAALRSGNMQAQEKIAVKLAQLYLFGTPPEQGLTTFTSLCYTIDEVKVRVLKRGGTTEGSNKMMLTMGIAYATSLSSAFLDNKRLDAIGDVADKIKESQNESAWMYPKIANFCAMLVNQSQALMFVESVINGWGERDLGQVDTKAKFGVTAKDILAQLLSLRKYGVKPCYFEDGMLQSPGNSWVFIDPMEYLTVGGYTRAMMKTEIMAVIHRADTASITDLRSKKREDGTAHYVRRGVKFGFEPNLILTLDSNGSLDYSQGPNIAPLEALFQQRGRPELYELVLLTHVLRLYDLLVPVEVARRMPRLQELVPPTPGFLKRLIGAKNSLSPVSDLMLPRLRVLDNPGMLERGMELEMEEAAHDTEKRTKREHWVVGHVRKLPPGKCATPEARALAGEIQIVLAADETFVRSHKRGNGNPVLTHRAVMRGGRVSG